MNWIIGVILYIVIIRPLFVNPIRKRYWEKRCIDEKLAPPYGGEK